MCIYMYTDEMVSGFGEEVVLAELGAGSATKTTYLISALLKKNKRLTFIPIDVAKGTWLRNSVFARVKLL